jgi:hypothetical protein
LDGCSDIFVSVEKSSLDWLSVMPRDPCHTTVGIDGSIGALVGLKIRKHSSDML